MIGVPVVGFLVIGLANNAVATFMTAGMMASCALITWGIIRLIEL